MVTNKPPIVLVHGLWMTPHSWQPWIDRYTRLGHETHAPGWPGVSPLDEPLDHDRAPTDISVRDIADHYEAFIRALPEPPILVGHSYGGLVVQILLDRGLGRAGVAIHPAQPRGVFRLPPSVLGATWPVLGKPANRHRAVPLTDKEFHRAFANTVSLEQAARERARLAIPGPGRPLFEVAFANLTPKRRAASYVNYRNGDRAPLLLIGGTSDALVPASVVRENHRRYRGADAVTDYHEFAGRDHLTAAQEGWEEVADDALTWAVEHPAPEPAHG